MNVEYVDHMGNDLSVVNAARVSFDKVSSYDVYGNLKNEDVNLINYLARGMSSKEYEKILQEIVDSNDREVILHCLNKMDADTHWTPFAHTSISLRVSAPIPIRTQCFKHKVGFVENEESRRYISSTPDLFIPKYFREKPSGSIKQGSGGKHESSDYIMQEYISMARACIAKYESWIEMGVSPEQARFILPQGVEVKWIWTGSLFAYANYYNKRTDSHAQGESQDLAREIGSNIRTLYPVSWKALTNE